MIHENWRWQPWYRAARDLIGTGAIGRPVTYRFRTCKGDGQGVEPYTDQPYFRQMPRLLIYETIVHHLDTARFLFGEISRVFAQARRNNSVIQGEDQAQLLLTHESSLLGSIDGHRFLDTDPPGPVLGEAWFEGDRELLRLSPSGDILYRNEIVWKNTYSQGYRGDSVRATQQHFIDCLRAKAEPESSARQYLKTVALVEAAYQSIRSACAVTPRT
jgi:predicted dehydrogenase